MKNNFLPYAPHHNSTPYLLSRGALGNRLIFVPKWERVGGNVAHYLVIHRNILYFYKNYHIIKKEPLL